MHVLLVNTTPIPVYAYGGTERVIWDLGKSLVKLGHKVSYLVPQGSHCDFARVLPIDTSQPWEKQIPADIDITHFQFNPQTLPETPYLVTEHGNERKAKRWPLNTVFVSKNHASRYGSDQYVLNGLDWDNYGAVDLDNTRTRFHFLGKAEWSVKNVSGAIRVAKKAGVELDVLGGNRINFRRGFRWTLSRSIHFHGMVGGSEKTGLLNASRGMIFPVRWHEPFGLAVIESLYFGCPVFATPYGALPELVPAECGVLSAHALELAHAVKTTNFDRRACHQHAVQRFHADIMARNYLQVYQRILDGETLHQHQPFIQGDARNLPWGD